MNDNNVILTVGLPAFNAEKGIIKSIESVLNQNWFGSMEVLVVDDGSTDDTVKLVEAFNDSRIRIIKHNSNMGRPVARNTVLENARGKYLSWIDADDEWLPDKLRMQFDELFSHEDIENIICICPYNLKWEHAGKFRLRYHQPSDDGLRDILSGRIPAYLWTMLSLKSVYDRAGLFDVRLNRLQDLDMLIRIMSTGIRFVRTDKTKPLCVYYKSDSDKTGAEVFGAVDTIWHKHKVLYEIYGKKFVKKTRYSHFELSARHSMKNEGLYKAGEFYLKSLMVSPKRTIKNTSNFFNKN